MEGENLGRYILLRTGRLSRVDVWTEQMKKDGRVIEGETKKLRMFFSMNLLGIV